MFCTYAFTKKHSAGSHKKNINRAINRSMQSINQSMLFSFHSLQTSPRPVFNNHINSKKCNTPIPISRFSDQHIDIVKMLQEGKFSSIYCILSISMLPWQQDDGIAGLYRAYKRCPVYMVLIARIENLPVQKI